VGLGADLCMCGIDLCVIGRDWVLVDKCVAHGADLCNLGYVCVYG